MIRKPGDRPATGSVVPVERDWRPCLGLLIEQLGAPVSLQLSDPGLLYA